MFLHLCGEGLSGCVRGRHRRTDRWGPEPAQTPPRAVGGSPAESDLQGPSHSSHGMSGPPCPLELEATETRVGGALTDKPQSPAGPSPDYALPESGTGLARVLKVPRVSEGFLREVTLEMGLGREDRES